MTNPTMTDETNLLTADEAMQLIVCEPFTEAQRAQSVRAAFDVINAHRPAPLGDRSGMPWWAMQVLTYEMTVRTALLREAPEVTDALKAVLLCWADRNTMHVDLVREFLCAARALGQPDVLRAVELEIAKDPDCAHLLDFVTAPTGRAPGDQT